MKDRTIASKKVKKTADRVEITYFNRDGEVVAHEDITKETYENNYPKEDE